LLKKIKIKIKKQMGIMTLTAEGKYEEKREKKRKEKNT